MCPHARDLVNTGVYIFSVGLLLGSVAFIGATALRALPHSAIFALAAEIIEPAATQETRLSQALVNSRLIKTALAKQIPRPEPLPPITAKLADVYLRPGGGVATAHNFEKSKLQKAGLDALALDGSNRRASGAVIPDLHRVY